MNKHTRGEESTATSDRTREKLPAAGPHEKPELTDPERTPGTGALPDPDSDRVETGTG